MSRRTLVVLALALAVLLALGVAGVALADPQAPPPKTDIGDNVGNVVRSWSKGLVFGVAALVGLPALARRDLGQGVVIVLLVILIGGMVFADTTVRTVIQSMWQTVAGTS